MGNADYKLGSARVELRCAEPIRLLDEALSRGLRAAGIETEDACTLRLTLPERDLPGLEALCAARNAELQILSRSGGRELLRRARRNALLLALLAAAALLLSMSSLFLWDIEAVGTASVSRGELLRALEDCGVRPGAFWPSLDPERVRSEVLLRLPQLGWMSLNLRSSRAVVLAEDRQPIPARLRERQPADLIAARDGLVVRCEIRAGRALVSPGQFVAAGETLVSGSLDSLCGETRLVRAEGSVLAETDRELTAVCPLDPGSVETPRFGFYRLALIVGKRRVNFNFGSSRTLDGYDRIEHAYKIGIEGVFSLPLSLVVERWSPRSIPAASLGAAAESARLERDLQAFLPGEILSAQRFAAVENGLLTLRLQARCREEIALYRETERQNEGNPHDRQNHPGRPHGARDPGLRLF